MIIKAFMRKIAKAACIVLYRIMNVILPVNAHRIVLSSSVAKSYSGNPKALYEELVREGLDKEYQCVWFYEKHTFDIPGRHIQVKYGRLKYLFYMATAKFLIFDARQPEFLRKRSKSIYLQTWHGTPLKKLALDMDTVFMAGETDIESYKESFRKNASTWDYLISQNPFSTETFRRAFDFNKEMLETGYPRNDSLFRHNNPDDIKEIKNKLGIDENKRVMLYAPTWRDDTSFGLGRYRYTAALDIDAMKEAFSDEYILIIKHHYLVEDNTDWSVYDGFVRVFDQSVDIAQMYLIADILITDYSSVMFDYSILKRPMYFYCYDLEKYKDVLRGFYFDFENNAPGPISLSTAELILDIKHEEHEAYTDKYAEFVSAYNPWDNVNSSKNVLDVIFKRDGR